MPDRVVIGAVDGTGASRDALVDATGALKVSAPGSDAAADVQDVRESYQVTRLAAVPDASTGLVAAAPAILGVLSVCKVAAGGTTPTIEIHNAADWASAANPVAIVSALATGVFAFKFRMTAGIVVKVIGAPTTAPDFTIGWDYL